MIKAICFLMVNAVLSPVLFAGEPSLETPLGDGESQAHAHGDGLSFSARKERTDWESAFLWADGIFLSSDTLYHQWTADAIDIGLQVDRRSYELDYEPRIFGFDTRLDRDQWTLSSDAAWRWSENFEWLGAVSYYDGFADYRSLWISEYYAQFFGGVPNYVDPSPKGFSVSSGLEWTYIPVMAKVGLTGGYARDTIAPAYDVTDEGVERSRPNLYTNFIRVTTENVLHRRLVVQNLFQYTDTTDREERWSFRSGWNWALNDDFTLRLHAGGAVEQPRFDALFGGATLERAFRDEWFLRLTGRYYRDTGEIENSLGGFTSAAPALDAFEVGLGLRWTGIHSSLNLYVGYYQTEYGALSGDNEFLENLYNDRRWGLLQIGYTYTF